MRTYKTFTKPCIQPKPQHLSFTRQYAQTHIVSGNLSRRNSRCYQIIDTRPLRCLITSTHCYQIVFLTYCLEVRYLLSFRAYRLAQTKRILASSNRTWSRIVSHATLILAFANIMVCWCHNTNQSYVLRGLSCVYSSTRATDVEW